MRKIQSFIVVLIAMLLSFICTTTQISAVSSQEDGLQIELNTDKDDYKKGDTAQIKLHVKNTNSYSVKTLTLESVLPEEFKVLDNNKVATPLLASNERLELNISAMVNEDKQLSPDENNSGTNDSSSPDSTKENGDSNASDTSDHTKLLWITISVLLSGGIIIVFIVRRKKAGKNILSIFLCLLIILSSFAPLPTYAKEEPTITSKELIKDIKVEEKNKQILAKISYEKTEEKKDEFIDADGDNCPDSLEKQWGLDTTKFDTDGDGLSDEFELLISLNTTDGTKIDTDGNGILDGDEDTDKDGLTNLQEQELGTDPLASDTDKDGLLDGLEVSTHKSNPLKDDTDEDKVTDSDEITLGLNPLNKYSDGTTLDGDRKIEQTLSQSKFDTTLLDSENAMIPSIHAQSSNVLDTTIEQVTKSSQTGLYDNRNIVGTPIDIIMNEDDTKNATALTLDYDYTNLENTLGSEVEKDLVICKYVDGKLVPYNSNIDTQQNVIRTEIDGSGTYIAVTLTSFLSSVGIDVQDQASSKKTKMTSDTEGQADIVFAIDTTGSMQHSINKVKNNINLFVDRLTNEYNVKVNFALVDYKDIEEDGESSTKVVKNGISNWFSNIDGYKQAITRINVNGGGDGPESSLDALETARKLDYRKNANKFVVLVTDDDYKIANTHGITSILESANKLAVDGVTSSVITEPYLFGRYNDIYSKTNGLCLDINSDFSSELLKLADLIGENTGGSWVLLDDFQYVKLGGELSADNLIDTDEDGITDYEELGTKKTVDLSELIEKLLSLVGVPPETYTGNKTIDVYSYLSNPVLQDTDADEVLDNEEVDIGTNARKYDTDADTLSDAEEINLGYDPIHANSDDDSFHDGSELEKDQDPFVYDKIWLDHSKDILTGALWGDAGQNGVNWGLIKESTYNSLGYLTGHIVSGLVVVGDIRDLIACVANGDVFGGFLNALGIVPAVGDIAKISSNVIQFISRSSKNIPIALTFMAKELEQGSKLYKEVMNEVLAKLCGSSDELSVFRKYWRTAGDETIAFLSKRLNDMPLLSKLAKKGLTIADDVITPARRAKIDERVLKFWGEPSKMSKKALAEAISTEAAIVRYQDEGYELLYAQRKLLNNGIHGPDIIMKKGDDILIVEAKGSYAKAAEVSDGKRAGARLSSYVNKKQMIYLSEDWLAENANPRYLNKYKELLEAGKNTEHGLKYDEAVKVINDIIYGQKNYNTAVVFTGINGSEINWGSRISEFANELINKNNVEKLDMIKMNY